MSMNTTPDAPMSVLPGKKNQSTRLVTSAVMRMARSTRRLENRSSAAGPTTRIMTMLAAHDAKSVCPSTCSSALGYVSRSLSGARYTQKRCCVVQPSVILPSRSASRLRSANVSVTGALYWIVTECFFIAGPQSAARASS